MRHFKIIDVPPIKNLPFFPCMIIVQARMSSTRLFGKVMKEVLGRPLLFYLVERLRRVRFVEGIVIATSQNPADDPIGAFCDKEGLHCVRQSEEDVLSRFYTASALFGLDSFVRVTADCPLIDPALIERGLSCFAQNYNELDYLSNCLVRTFPRGMDFEIVKQGALQKAFFEATSSYDKEHVTPFIVNHPEKFRLANISQENDQSQYRLTVDQQEDFELVKRLLEALYPKNPEFTLEDIVQMLKIHQDWIELNAHVQQKT